MTNPSSLVPPDVFQTFNQNREELASQFRELVLVMGNHIFGGDLDPSQPQLLSEINKQTALLEAERNILKNLYFYAVNLLESRFLVGFLGRFKAGKSTLLNAIAGQDISPMNTRISTGVLNFIGWAEEESCSVVYDSGQTVPIDPTQKEEYIDYRSNPDNERGVHHVMHQSPHLDLQHEILFVDTPGLEAVNSVHEKITLDFVVQCHAAVLVSTYPPFGEGELRFYQRIAETIPNVFLVQNLPADKLSAWLELECQTLESLHKLGFYKLEAQYGAADSARAVLRKIADEKDESGLESYKNVHGIHLYSLNAKGSYEVIRKAGRNADVAKLAEHRFDRFHQELYRFLAESKGQKLIESYAQKGRLMLGDLIQLVRSKRDILQKSLAEIDQEIEENRRAREKAVEIIEMLVDRAKLKVLETFKKFQQQMLEEDLRQMLDELNRTYGEANVFRMKKNQVKKIKLQIIEFNRLFGHHYQEYIAAVREVIRDAQEKIAQEIKKHSIFKEVSVESLTMSVSMREISGLGCIDHAFEFLFRGGMAYVVGSAAGGSGLALLTLVGIGPTMALLIGGAIGLGLAFPLEKYIAPVLEFCKGLVSKIANKPARTIFETFRSDVRQKLDEVEHHTVDAVVNVFKGEVARHASDYFAFFEKTLQELRHKKESGFEKAESARLQEILEELEHIGQNFNLAEQNSEAVGKKPPGVLEGLKSFIRNLGKK